MQKYRLAEKIQRASIIGMLAVVVIGAILRWHYMSPAAVAVFLVFVGAFLICRAYLDFVPKPKATDAWLIKAICYYRQFGFFAKYDGLPDEEVLAKLKSRYTRRLGDTARMEAEDINLLCMDKQRVFCGDTEADVMPANHVYVKTLKSLARISRGAFQPSEISEVWESEEGPICVEFTLAGEPHSFQPKYDGDWLDPRIMAEVDRLMKDSGIRIRSYNTEGQDFILLALTDEEAKQIRRERGLNLS